MAIAGADRTILLGNAEIERLTGFSREEVIDAGIKWESFIALHDLERLEGYHESRLGDATRTPKQYEFQIRTKKGELKDIFMTSGLIPGTKKSLVSMMDITDRKKAEMQLQKSEERLRELLARSSDVISIIDERGVFLYVSPSVKQILFHEPADLISKSSLEFIHPDDLEIVSEALTEVIMRQNKSIVTEFRFRRGDGTWADLEALSNNCLNNPAINGIIINAREISERKKAAEELQKSEIRIQELLRNSFDIIVVQDERGVYRYVSPSVKRILGYSEADLIGRQCFDFLHPDERKKAFDTYNKIIADKKNEFIAEFRLLHRNGSWINMELLGNNCLDNPAVNGIIISARDVTDRKRIETRLSHSQKMEAIGTLAGGIAHDFNNLLMGIQGYVSLMLLRKDEGDPDFAKLNNIQNLVQRGADLTAKLLGFARGGQYEVKPADLNELISRTVNIFARTKKEITIHQKYAKNLWTVEVDRSQIEQVLINIYVNAWQAMTREGGDIYVETDNIVINAREARLLSMRAGDYVRTTITDTGSGMAEDTRSRVFEPFFTTKEKSRGVGLSLASAYGIIREHGGTIEVASELGQGTVFNIYIPASAKEIAKETTEPEAIVAGVETILLVDDEESVLDVCKEILIAMGYNVLCADNGREALNIYGMYKNKIDLVMLDMIMPGLSGSETYDAMKLINPQVKVMLSTGYSVSDQAKQIMGRGCQALIQKPFRMDDLSQKIREVIGSK
jgi:two-component system, cell cycle sensor histidine kinase and response regulator CckA